MRGKDRVDPELARLVEQRLERLLSERAPRRADRGGETAEDPADVDLEGDVESGEGAEEFEPRWRQTGDREAVTAVAARRRADGADAPRRWPGFTRAHLAVVGVLVALAVLLAGWAVLRARPVPLPAAAVSVPRPTPGTVEASAEAARASGSPRASPRPIVVHVFGAVRRPGLVRLPELARVQDAIDRAGGLRPGAQLGDLNLAQVLSDGQQVSVGQASAAGSQDRSAVRGGGPPTAPGSAGAGSGPQVDLNTATAAQLENLPGVGPVTAAKIIAWREQHGRFSRVEELQEVAGIGPKTYADIAPHCRV